MTASASEVKGSVRPSGTRGQEQPVSGDSGPPSATLPAREELQVALSVGWQVAHIFHTAWEVARAQVPPSPAAHQRGAGPETASDEIMDLSPQEELDLRLSQVTGTLRKLEVPGLPDAVAQGGRTPTDVRSFHVKLLSVLTEMDAHLAKAYWLGQALGDLSLRPSRDPSALGNLCPGRMDTIEGWLKDLKSLLADHAVTTVLGSLRHWQNWVLQHPSIWHESETQRTGLLSLIPFGKTSETDEASDTEDHRAIVARALVQQGSRWRALLTGEKLATDSLTSDDYVLAGTALLRKLRSLTASFLKQYWLGFLVLLAAVGGVIATAFVVTDDAATGVTSLAAVIGGFGISAKAIQETLVKAASYLRDTLWEAQLDQACIKAVTVLPFGVAPEVEAAKLHGLRTWWSARKLRKLRQQSIREAATAGAELLKLVT